MRKRVLLLAVAGLCMAAAAPKTFTGIVGDDVCEGDHKTMGGTDATRCAAECIKSMKAKYALTLPTGKETDKTRQVVSIRMQPTKPAK